MSVRLPFVESGRRGAWLDVAAYAGTGLAWALTEWFVVERAAYRSLLGLGNAALRGDEHWLVPLVVIGNTLLFLLPALLLASGLALRGRQRAGFVGYLAAGALGAAAVTLDLRVYSEFGRHLSEILHFMALPRGYGVGGDTGPWLRAAVQTSLVLSAAFVLLATVCRVLVHAALRRTSRAFIASLCALSATSSLALGLGAPVLASGFSHSVVLERVYSSLPFDLRPHGTRARFDDPALAQLASALSDRYHQAFPRVVVQHALPGDLELKSGVRPNIVLIVLESWRSDALDPRWMPRLDAWSKHGLRLDRHYAGSDYSEAGMFALLYGRSPLVYHAALDAQLRPDLVELLHHAGYGTAYFSGQPLDWERQEEFIGKKSFDRFEHDDAGSWVDWDKKALSRAVAAARGAGAQPLFALVYLMSSHFEYQYPPEYERYRPVDKHVRMETTRMVTLGPDARLPLTNRYHNSLAFLDDLIADSLAELDPAKDLVIVTGDHGESLDDDGRFGHGYGFPDVVARTPMVVGGPGIDARVESSSTLHVDLLPTIAHVLAGHPVSLPELDGVDLLASSPERSSVLLAHCSFERDAADALLISGSRRLRLELGLRSATVDVKGFEDPLGHLLPFETIPASSVDALAADFDRELLIIGGRAGR
jgi:Sulfatase